MNDIPDPEISSTNKAIPVLKYQTPPSAQRIITAILLGEIKSPDDFTPENKKDLATLIDHTLLKPEATRDEIILLCQQADQYSFASAVAQPLWIKLIRQTLQNPRVKVCGISGFPLGGHKTRIKALEAELCVEDGADEVDMVMNLGFAKQGDWKAVQDDIEAVAKAISGSALLKVILECSLLTDEEKIKGCLCAVDAGAQFVKTSTGFSTQGAKASDVALLRKVVGPDFGVKASGGIRTLEQTLEMVKAGANRIGTSAGVKIMNG
jgi:deoxyribose-phosphate aldolase